MDEALNSYFPMCSVQRTQTYLTKEKIHDLEKPAKIKKRRNLEVYPFNQCAKFLL